MRARLTLMVSGCTALAALGVVYSLRFDGNREGAR